MNSIEFLRCHGDGNVTGSVSKNAGCLPAGDSPGFKLDKARELGVSVLVETQFRKLLGGDTSGTSEFAVTRWLVAPPPCRF